MEQTKEDMTTILGLVESAKDSKNINDGMYLRLCNTMKGAYDNIGLDYNICPCSGERLEEYSLNTTEGIKIWRLPTGFFDMFTRFCEVSRAVNEENKILRATKSSLEDSLVEKETEIHKLKDGIRNMDKLFQLYKMKNTQKTLKKNEDKVETRPDEKVECSHCGSLLAPTSLKQHYKTKKCKSARRRARRFVK